MFPDRYTVLPTEKWSSGNFGLVPIRYEDRMAILLWRNEQMYHLRQSELLTATGQEHYFTEVVRKLFDQEKPAQLLFSFLENGRCIGYGGLVHINWNDQHAEISFIMETALEKERFQELWTAYLGLIEQVAFSGLQLHKVSTYAYDLRPHLYKALEASGYRKESILKEHCLFEGRFIDVVIHSKIAGSTFENKEQAPVLESERLLLQPLSSDFLSEDYASWLNDPQVNCYLETPANYTMSDLKDFLKEVDEKEILFWAVVHKADNRHIGNIKIDPVNLKHGSGEYGILMGDVRYGKQGFAKEASETVIRYCFEELRLRRINLGVVADNTSAVELYKKLGFETEGVHKAAGFYDHKWCNVLRMALFNPDLQL